MRGKGGEREVPLEIDLGWVFCENGILSPRMLSILIVSFVPYASILCKHNCLILFIYHFS